MTRQTAFHRTSTGFTLIEVLVTIIIMLIGMLGLVGLQSRASNTEFESYQRGQALSLARDMEARITASRTIIKDGFLQNALSSTDGSVAFGTGSTNFADAGGNCLPGAAPLDAAKYEICQWGQALLGVALKDGGNGMAAMVGARGCVIRVEPPNNNALADVFVVVVWQGQRQGTPLSADSPASLCGGDTIDANLKRGLSLRVMVPDLNKT